MSDLIDREIAIDRLKTVPGVGNKALDTLRELPSAQPEQRWIPVSEKQPLVSGEFLVTLTDKDGEWVSTAEWNTTFGGRWQDVFPDDGYCDISNVIAWMPLPEPLKGEQS